MYIEKIKRFYDKLLFYYNMLLLLVWILAALTIWLLSMSQKPIDFLMFALVSIALFWVVRKIATQKRKIKSNISELELELGGKN